MKPLNIITFLNSTQNSKQILCIIVYIKPLLQGIISILKSVRESATLHTLLRMQSSLFANKVAYLQQKHYL